VSAPAGRNADAGLPSRTAGCALSCACAAQLRSAERSFSRCAAIPSHGLVRHCFCRAGEYNDFNTGPAIATNTWRHGCATWDGTTVRFYEDGVLVASGAPAAGAYNTLGASQLVIGAFVILQCPVASLHTGETSWARACDRLDSRKCCPFT